MAQYYGVERSNDYLAHYGIKGMKWGVRKALERGTRALSRQYQKAQKKLERLESRDDSKNNNRKSYGISVNMTIANRRFGGAVGTPTYIRDHRKSKATMKRLMAGSNKKSYGFSANATIAGRSAGGAVGTPTYINNYVKSNKNRRRRK